MQSQLLASSGFGEFGIHELGVAVSGCADTARALKEVGGVLNGRGCTTAHPVG